MTTLNNDQLTRAVKSVAAQNRKQRRNLWIAIAALGVLMVLVVVAMFLNVNAATRTTSALEKQEMSGTQDTLLTRCLAVVAYEGVDNKNRYGEVVDFCIYNELCKVQNLGKPTAAAVCSDNFRHATQTAELQTEQ